jgi:hypothetical protein
MAKHTDWSVMGCPSLVFGRGFLLVLQASRRRPQQQGSGLASSKTFFSFQKSLLAG